ncbi:hypothetical protein LXA43DRAFT_855794, partial [Ganoderma leucocontextum]
LPMPPLLTLRCTCKQQLRVTTLLLQNAQQSLLELFVSCPDRLASALTAYNGYVCGSVALEFVLRRGTSRFGDLDIAVPQSNYADFVYHMRNLHQALVLDQTEPNYEDYEPGWDTVATLRTPRGTIRVFRSTCEDALLPIVLQWASHKAVYFNASYFGTPYPNLLFRHRSLLGDVFADEAAADVGGLEGLVQKHEVRGIQIQLFMRQWPDYEHQPCSRSSFTCPAQPRSLGD